MINQFFKKVSVRKVLVIFGVFFSTLTIPTGNQVTKSSNKPTYPKHSNHCRVAKSFLRI